jgi:hypothetical protein
MAVNNAAHIRQADSAPFKFSRAMQTLENPKKLVSVTGIEADTIVSNENDLFILRRLAPDFDLGGFASASVFEGIAD